MLSAIFACSLSTGTVYRLRYESISCGARCRIPLILFPSLHLGASRSLTSSRISSRSVTNVVALVSSFA